MKNNSLRLQRHPVLDLSHDSRPVVEILVNGQPVEAREGESLAAALWANGLLALRHDPADGAGRGMYCGIGHCYECRVEVDGVEGVRSCLIAVREGMQVILAGRDVEI
jgi:sarcosine oxidase subunit alpha